MSNRRDFLRALTLGSGAVLIGNNWYRKGRGLIQPPEFTMGETYTLADPYGIGSGDELWLREHVAIIRPGTGLLGQARVTAVCTVRGRESITLDFGDYAPPSPGDFCFTPNSTFRFGGSR